MSTILDALRKVQRERDRETHDLRQALTEAEPRRSSGFGPGHWMVVAGLVLLAGGVSAYLFVGGDRPGEAISAQAPDPVAAEATHVAAAQGGAADPAQLEAQKIREVLDGLSRGKDRSSRSGRPSAKKPAVMSASRRRRIVQAMVARSSPTAEIREAEGSGETGRADAPLASVAPPRARSPEPEPPAPVARVTPPREPQPVAEPEPVRVAAVTPPPREEPAREPVVAKPDPGSYPDPDLFTVRFPDLRLEAVRWHPDSTRREARLLVDSTRSVSAREGDVIVGVAVHRIDPGAVELHLGDTVRLIYIGQ